MWEIENTMDRKSNLQEAKTTQRNGEKTNKQKKKKSNINIVRGVKKDTL